MNASIVSFFSTLIGLSIGSLAYSYLKLYKRNKKLEENLKLSIEESLDLATSEQLTDQQRKRASGPYILLTPIEGEDNAGVTIEIHSMSPINSISLLKFATAATASQLKKNGVDIPMDETEGFNFGGGDYDGEPKY